MSLTWNLRKAQQKGKIFFTLDWTILHSFRVVRKFWSRRLSYFFFYFISFAQKKNQTNRKNIGRDTATAVANYSGSRKVS